MVWLHGLGADGHDFDPLFRQYRDRLPAGLKVILPHAPARPVTINGGMTMRAWYDIRSPELTGDVDREGIRESAAAIGQILAELEGEGIAARRIVLGGFSQGGVLALWTGLGHGRSLAGIAGLSAYLPEDPPVAEAQRGTPLFLGHGRLDSLIPFSLGTAARDRLPDLGASIPAWHEYEMDHGVCGPEAEDLVDWLKGILAG